MASISVQSIEEAADSRVQTFPLQHLSGAVIGVDASYYLDKRLNNNALHNNKEKTSRVGQKSSHEPLFNALSGFPFCLEDALKKDVEALKKQDSSLLFVFNGLDYATKEPSSAKSAMNLRAHEEGWQAYENGSDVATLEAFRKADHAVETLFRWFQRLLQKMNVNFLVAPYGAIAQLAYLEKQPEQFIDAVMGSTECFLFHTDKIILDFDLESSTFTWLKKSDCQDLLERAPNDFFRDIQLLLGSSFLPPFPLLGRSSGKATVREAVVMLNTAGRNVMQLCQQYREDPQVMLLQYGDRYKKAIMTIRHHVVLEKDGKVSPMDYVHAPGDVHEFIGQRLPEELFFYISKGMLGAQIPSWLASSEVALSLPAGAQDSEAYRKLVVDQLNPIRATTLKMISESLHRYYQSRTIKISPWFERDTANLAITIREVPAVASKLEFWKIKSSDLPAFQNLTSAAPTFLDAMRSLKDLPPPAQPPSKTDSPSIMSALDIKLNVMWRFLQLREYVDEKHQTTKWGNALIAVLESLESDAASQEIGLLAIELLRLGLINGADLSGTTRAVDSTTYKINLLSRVACLGPLKATENEGYSGPLERSLLTFAWMINAVRVALRDLAETVLVCMFLSGAINRSRSDWSQLAAELPFAIDNGCGLGLVAHLYLNEAEKNAGGKVPAEPIKTIIKKQGKTSDKEFTFFQHLDIGENLETAFGIWDAILEGTKVLGADFEDSKTLIDINDWLTPRR